MVGNELSEILVGRHHESVEALLLGFHRQRGNYIIGLESRHLDYRDAVGLKNLLDVGNGELDVLGCGFALGLVGLIRLVPESRALGVEAHGDVRRVFLLQYIVKCVDKSENSRSVHAAGSESRSTDKCIICSENQGICIEEEEFLRFHTLS